MNTLPVSFYTRKDIIAISRELLGKALVTEIEGQKTSGIIVETEAYAGPADRACHAYQRRHTARTAPMFREGGIAYIYLIYGIYHLFNIVTNEADEPFAILVRAIEPVEGIDIMMHRRKMNVVKPQLCGGPGTLSMALGITTRFSGESLQGPHIRIEDRDIRVAKKDIISATRVGVAYAQEDALLPYRFYIRDNPWVSKAKGL
ncbi:MAG: DNA-3-methyladenine glycosylase [Bacteroidetes bacterium]|nr:DNA-3-methyladenine glycosylase [Bacteroidota bacterium]MBS1629797.1 DNA-3-methyladenine glycosylase [Bacteroidota bacterium]